MPTLDDTPIVPALTALASGDLIPVCDVSEASGKKPKAITVANLIETALDTLTVGDGTGISVGNFYVDSVTGIVTKKLA